MATHPTFDNGNDRLIKLRELMAILDISRSTAYRLIHEDPKFPPRLYLRSGNSSMRFRLSDVLKYGRL